MSGNKSDSINKQYSFSKEQELTITVKVESSISSNLQLESPTSEASHDNKENVNNNNNNTKDDEKRSSSVSLPPIGHILKSIDVYQTQQQLSDSQLLLELNQRQPTAQDQQSGSEEGANHQPQQLASLPSPILATAPPLQQQASQQTDPPQQILSGPQGGYLYSGLPSYNQQQIQDSYNDAQSNTPYQLRNKDSSLPNNRRRLSNAQQPPAQYITQQQQLQQQLPLLDTMQAPQTPMAVTFETPSRHSSVESLESYQSGGSLTPNSANNKKRTNLPRETIEILNDWILNNMDNPYPNHTQKRILLERTGLSSIQLSNWFINKRRRRIFSNLSGTLNGQPIKKKRLIDRI